MLTLLFIHNFAPKKFKPKAMDRKNKSILRKITLFISFQDLIFGQRSIPHRKPCVQKFSTKKLYTGEIMSVSAVPNAESNNDLVVDNPKPNL